MKSPVNCNNCNKVYQLDLAKYGGKKIKCKACAAVIIVPDADDEFEVIEEVAAAPPPQPQSSRPAGMGLLGRERTGSKFGAVNIALLQRAETSRQEVRNNFLSLHGNEQNRLTYLDGIKGLITESEEKITATNQAIEAFKQWGKGGTAGLGGIFGGVSDVLGVAGTMMVGNLGQKSASADPVFALAAEMTGVNPEDSRYNAGGGSAGIGGIADSYKASFGAMGSMFGGGKAKADPIKDAKQEVITAALAKANSNLTQYQNELIERKQGLTTQQTVHNQEEHEQLRSVSDFINAGDYATAHSTLNQLIKTADVSNLKDVLASTAICAFATGNPTDAAKNMQDAVCFGASVPPGREPAFNDLWAKASSGLPKV